MRTVNATDLARQTRDILDRASRGETIVVERNHLPIAHIGPPQRMMTAREALEGLSTRLTPEQARVWAEDSRGTFDDAVRDPWA